MVVGLDYWVSDLGVFGTLPEANDKPLLVALALIGTLAAVTGSEGGIVPGPVGIRRPRLLM